MKVRLKTGYFGNRLYQIDIDEEGILFSSDSDTIRVDCDSISSFSVNGGLRTPRQFLLVTKENIYEGDFISVGDVKEFVETLCKKSDQKYKINLSIE